MNLKEKQYIELTYRLSIAIQPTHQRQNMNHNSIRIVKGLSLWSIVNKISGRKKIPGENIDPNNRQNWTTIKSYSSVSNYCTFSVFLRYYVQLFSQNYIFFFCSPDWRSLKDLYIWQLQSFQIIFIVYQKDIW